MNRFFLRLRRSLRNERGEITFFACFFVVGVVMLISFLLLYASVRITCINIRNGAKMELNNLSATIYADTYRSQRETNFEEYLRTLYSSNDYTEMLEATVAGGLAEKIPLSTEDYEVSNISLEFNVVGDRVEYIFFCDVEFYVRLVPHMGKISYIEDACIHYVQRKTSLNYGTTLKTMDSLKILADIRDSYREEGLYETYREALEFLHIRILLCSSFRRMVRIPDKRDRKMALEAAWHTLEDNFPNWKQNTYLRKLRTKKGWYMRAMNRSLYRICGTCLPYLYKIR